MHFRSLTWSFLSLSALLGAPAALQAQEFRSQKCETVREPIGIFTAEGAIRYQLGANGVPDTASVEVLAVEKVTADGFRSAAVRQLAACKMQRPPRALVVVQRLRFDSLTASLDPATPTTEDGPPRGPNAAPTPVGSGIYAANDGALEERPRWISCDRAPRTRVTTSTGISHAADAAAADPADRGLVTAALVVGRDGRVMKDSVTLIRSDNPQATSKIMRSLATCRFAPGRIAGLPVLTRVEATMILSPTGYTVVDHPGRPVLNPR